MTADNARAMGVYPFFRPLDFNNGPEAQLEGRTRGDARVEQLPRPDDAPQGARGRQGGHRQVRHQHDRLAPRERDDAAPQGARGQARRLPRQGGGARLHHRLPGEHRHHLGARSQQEERRGDRQGRPRLDLRRRAPRAGGRRAGWCATSTATRPRSTRPSRELEDAEGALVVTDGVFSAQGEIANLPRARRGRQEAQGAAPRRRRARARRDRPRAAAGRRRTSASPSEVDLIGGTFSKSLASIGGWLVGDRKVLDYVQHFAYSFLFAASAAPPCVAAAMAALEVMQEEPWRQDKLRENFTYMRDGARAARLRAGQDGDGGHPHLHPRRPEDRDDVEEPPRRLRRSTSTPSSRPASRRSSRCSARATWRRTSG